MIKILIKQSDFQDFIEYGKSTSEAGTLPESGGGLITFAIFVICLMASFILMGRAMQEELTKKNEKL